MQYPVKLRRGILIKRYKRFLADVELDDGSVVTAHCANTGAMTGCAVSGWQVWLSHSDNPKRKLAFSWELVLTTQGQWIGINTHKANELVAEALADNRLKELLGYSRIQREVKFGQENSRIDFLLRDDKRADCYLEVKSVTLLQNGQGYFPDAVSLRGQKHLRELSQLAREGKRAVLLFCVQHSGIHSVKVAQHIDPLYALELNRAVGCGVEIFAYGVSMSPEKIFINQAIPFIF
ncbi:DNA/RNA nuclease SfsA [Paraglaciecola sp. 25GB23A]|jgi:sugar fermentation stimulation protein A|uniref:DNA/RNA nuclease SfsA n=1 Tax=Paraglaciecola sp. 25GB23A TaxID=3156068 RepID=UPI0032AFD3A4